MFCDCVNQQYYIQKCVGKRFFLEHVSDKNSQYGCSHDLKGLGILVSKILESKASTHHISVSLKDRFED